LRQPHHQGHVGGLAVSPEQSAAMLAVDQALTTARAAVREALQHARTAGMGEGWQSKLIWANSELHEANLALVRMLVQEHAK